MPLNSGQMMRKLKLLADASIAEHSGRFFKSGKGQYGEGDRFLGIRVPVLRKLAKECRGAELAQALDLLQNEFHEARLFAVLLMVDLYKKGSETEKSTLCRQYLAHARYVNNWDIVDSSAPYILGPELLGKDHGMLFRLAASELLWERRIAVLATFHFIRHHDYGTTLRLAELLIGDKEDLMHKACGWMLREVANRDLAVARTFLDRHAPGMPRTMLRYAIEKFPEKLRQQYLKSR